jgi:hypothetical protein
MKVRISSSRDYDKNEVTLRRAKEVHYNVFCDTDINP